MTREEAIEIVKKHGISADGTKFESALRELIPELRESEDERIKKIITDSVFYQYGAGVEYKDVLDYLDKLEKQKVQKPLPPFDEPTPEEKMNHPLYLEGFDTGRKVQRVFDEQKPADWSEEERNTLLMAATVLKSNFDSDEKFEGCDYDCETLAGKLLEMRYSTSHSWKPSEEQMKALNEIANILSASPFLHQNDYLFNILNGLREELKKLL